MAIASEDASTSPGDESSTTDSTPPLSPSSHVRRVMRPLWLFLPISLTIASIYNGLRGGLIHRGIRIYAAGTVLISIIILATSMHVFSSQALNILHGKNFIVGSYIYHIIITTGMLIRSRKNKMVKLIQEINELDVLIQFDNEAVSRNLLIYNTCYAVGIVSYQLLTSGAVLWILCCTDKVYCIIGTQTESYCLTSLGHAWRSILLLMSDAELLSLHVAIGLLTSRATCFASKLDTLLQDKTASAKTTLNVLVCYRKLLRILNLINKIWYIQIAAILVYNFYYTLRGFLILIFYASDRTCTSQGFLQTVEVIQKIIVTVILGLSAQRVAQELGGCLRRLATLRDQCAGEPGAERLESQCARAALLREVGRARLRVLGWRALDGTLPLRMFSLLASAIIILLQLGFKP